MSGKRTGKVSARSVALEILQQVLFQGRSLAIARSRADRLDARERALCMELVNGVLRWRWKLEALVNSLLTKPLKKKEQALQVLLMLALYELMELSTPGYAVVNEAVKLSHELGKGWASGLVNGVLRSFSRDREACLAKLGADEVATYSHPDWLIERLQRDWPEHWQQILQANNQRPPMWLRINARLGDTRDYQRELQQQEIQSQHHASAPQALRLIQRGDVSALPGFEQGRVSVQDAGAQLAAVLLDVQPGQRVLDLCAAPGGKTCHLLELYPELESMTAVELDASRMDRVRDNFQRLGLDAELVVADATTADWWNGECFERVLVDAPCSASGVIRRHPDIKSLRRESDLESLVAVQQQILEQAWQMLCKGGELLYVTCSVLREENEDQIADLLAEHVDADEIAIDQSWGQACRHGRQLLPGEDDADGFYYARLRKSVGSTG